MSFKDYFDVYEFSCELPGTKENITFKPLTTKKIKKLLNYDNSEDFEQIENVLDFIINDSVVDEEFNVDKIYLQDRFYLLNEIRKKTKGETYEFDFTCPECKSQSFISINLDELKVTPLNEKIDNRIALTDKITIEIWYVTREEEKEALKRIDKNINNNDSKHFEHQLNILTSSIKAIETPDGRQDDLSFDDKKWIIDNMSIDGLTKIKNWFDENSFGLDWTIEWKCKQCGYTKNASIPLQNFFF